MNCILLDHGGNDYQLPHMGKKALERQGLLPTSLRAPQEVIDFWNNNTDQPTRTEADLNNNE
jgi:hypothetical protein